MMADTHTRADKSRPAVLASPSIEETRERVGALWEFVSSHRQLSDAHTVEFFTEDVWNSHLSDDWRSQLQAAGDSHYFVDPPRGQKGVLLEFLLKAQVLSLPTVRGFAEKSRGSLQSFGMKQKKSHEVGEAALFVACQAERLGLSQVLDIGSGKGYLSEHLALHHGLTVVGVDSQESNTHGAAERNMKIYKAWRNITSQVSRSRAQEEVNRPELKPSRESSPLPVDQAVGSDCSTETVMEGVDLPHKASTSTLVSCEGINCSTSIAEPGSGDQPLNTSSIPVTRYEARTRLGEMMKAASYVPVTERIALCEDSDCDKLLKVAEEQSSGRFSAGRPTYLVGLHACGDLTPSILWLYHKLPSVKAVCVVGCCYQHVTESCRDGKRSFGFPMSGCLQSVRAMLGRNTRMLALQSFTSLESTASGVSLESVFRRAVLQVLLARNFEDTYKRTRGVHPLMVGKFRHTPKDFKGYIRAAAGRLGIELSEISDQNLELLESEFIPRKPLLERFLKVRAILATCIESLIILDRLLYLQEQGISRQTSVVQLFDPDLSPRCFALTASK